MSHRSFRRSAAPACALPAAALFTCLAVTFAASAQNPVPTAHRESGALGEEPSENELMRLYDLSRPAMQRILSRLSDLGLVERKPGHGWRFQPTTADEALRGESYRFRLLLEPAGLLEPSFRADHDWLAQMRARHLATI